MYFPASLIILAPFLLSQPAWGLALPESDSGSGSLSKNSASTGLAPGVLSASISISYQLSSSNAAIFSPLDYGTAGECKPDLPATKPLQLPTEYQPCAPTTFQFRFLDWTAPRNFTYELAHTVHYLDSKVVVRQAVEQLDATSAKKSTPLSVAAHPVQVTAVPAPTGWVGDDVEIFSTQDRPY